MKTIDFLERIHRTDLDVVKTLNVFEQFVFSKEFQDDEDISSDAKRFFEDVWSQNDGQGFSSLSSKLDYCLGQCKSKLNNEDTDASYKAALEQVERIIDKLLEIYNKVAQGHQNDNKDKNKKLSEQGPLESTIVQHEESLKEINDRISGLNAWIDATNNRIDAADKRIEAANSRIDDKVFTLLLNTVAILGIFVAISFTGFGTVSIFSSINLEAFSANSNSFFRSIFFLLLVGLLSYNLLLLLVYFIFKLSHPVFPSSNTSSNEGPDDQGKEFVGFRGAVRFDTFLTVDFIMMLFVALFFFFGLCE